MATKRLTIELPVDQYEYLRKEAGSAGTTVSGLIRKFIDTFRLRVTRGARTSFKRDPFYQRHGSFEGPSNLAEDHDRFLYGEAG